MIRPALLLVCFCFLPAVSRATAAAEPWRPLTWHGERALVSDSHGRRAIVSLERGRLLHFGLTDREANTLLAPSTRAQRNYWGGHRLWLGPQSTWGKFWPPPDAWEYLGAESFTAEAGVLRLVMPDAGEGWPRLRRTYQWDGPHLVCGAELLGGTRPAQIIQILQLPATARVRKLKPQATPGPTLFGDPYPIPDSESRVT